MNFDFGCIEGKTSAGVLYLKPTNGWDDIRLYVGIIPVRNHAGGWVHGLIYLEYLRRRIDLLRVWKESGATSISGYSLGAAWAKFLAVDISILYNEKPTVRLRGAPYVGSKKWAQVYNELAGDTEQVVYGRDIVTNLLPWATREKGYTSCGGSTKWWQIIKMFKDHVAY